ncbi:TonB-linked outer membrane protein, SusC/RagA family [Salinimicrobium sediminis]|uniref:TonB-linked outer membrane protein, SusC/RagA family n=1 Tax=Salinimicrobium sediminis TaxID=1343891 RepID=A0A285X1X0_9FLAO|nr:TonB-dependent receptor [Salinimicrobium sediminis]SOC79337.1 TonB-linked outer membrane protein, SusC/RagA family [Salinimicrobium sediminis]
MNFKLNELSSRVYLFLLGFFLLLGSEALAQESITVSGTVLDSQTQEPLPGVNILEKGTSNGTMTNFDGEYSIEVSGPNSVLVYSFVGFRTQEVNVNGRNNIRVEMQLDQNALDEVVVVGYGTARKSDLTGSVVSISGDKLDEQARASVAETLTGRLPGVQVLSTEGSPDAEINIRIRGNGSLTQDSSPLIIVDGFPVASMGDISPTDIASISVLKDASSTAIYGSRGANGVIIITTKDGISGKISVSVNGFYGFQKIAETIDVLSPEDFVKWQYEYALLDDPENLDSYERFFGLWQDYDLYVGQEGNNWQKQIYGNMGEVQSHDISIRGGSEKASYNFNYAHYDVNTIMLGSAYTRDNLALALKSEAGEKVDLSFTVRYSETEIDGGGTNEQNEVSSADSRLKYSVQYSPIPISGLTTTNTDEALTGYLVNPFVATADNDRQQLRRNYNMLGSFGWDIVDNLRFQSDFGLDYRIEQDYRYYGRSTYYSRNRPSADNQGLPSLVYSDRKRESFRNANTLNYDFEDYLGEDHNLRVLLGQEVIITEDNEETSEIQGFPKDFNFETTRKLTTQGTPQSVDNFYRPDDKLLSFFGRVNYDFRNKYLLTGTFRADGSSKFLGDNRWGYFPSAAVAWKINEEDFLQDAEWLDVLKLRLSYGEAGNNNIPAGQTVQSFQSNTTTYLNGIPTYWSASRVLANPDLKWETTVTQNVGLDFEVMQGVLRGSLEAYKNVTTDLLLAFRTPGSGYEYQYRNLGEIQNTGVEGSINYNPIMKDDYRLSLALNVSANKNRINSLGSLENYQDYSGWASSEIGSDYAVWVGQPVGAMYGYRNAGRYEVADFNFDPETNTYTLREGVVDNSSIIGEVRPGSIKLEDITGDGIVDINDNSIIGDANPDFTGGFVIDAYVYGFDFSAAFNFSVGNDVYNANKVQFTTANENGQYRNLSSEMADGIRWTNLNPETGQLITDPEALAAANANTSMWSPYMGRYVFSDWAVEDGSFLRLNTLTLGYTVPNALASRANLTKLRFYATANNVFILTDYSGLDPEVSTRRRSPLTPGVDYSPFPRSKQIVFGLNLNF